MKKLKTILISFLFVLSVYTLVEYIYYTIHHIEEVPLAHWFLCVIFMLTFLIELILSYKDEKNKYLFPQLRKINNK